jgi:hypothetical protein
MKWKLGRSAKGADGESAGRSISQRAKAQASPGCMAAFFGVFLVAGLGFLMFFLWPAVKVVRAQSWEGTKCEVERSWVESHSGEDGATYSIEVRYRYEVDGVEYAGDRYEFMGGSSSGHDSKQKIVDRLSSGSVTTCYYDPDDPASSVLHRGFSWVYLFGLLPLVFVGVGAGGIYWALGPGRRKLAATQAGSSSVSAGPASVGPPSGDSRFAAAGSFREIDEWSTPVVESGPIELEESLGPVGKLVGLVFISLFWNGIVSVFVWQAWQAWRSEGEFEAGCLSLFLVPFVLIGLAMLVGIPYQVLALANPRPKLTLSSAAVPLGGSAQLQWRFSGSAGRLRKLRIYLEGSEHARYRRGTSTHTDTEVFTTIEVVDRREGMPLATGSATIEIPEDTMHSFEGGNNKIVWTLKLLGDIPFWPDVITEFSFVVRPSRS